MWGSGIKVRKDFFHSNFENSLTVMLSKEGEKQQGSNRFMHHVRRGPIPHLLTQQLDLPSHSCKETVLIHEIIIPRHNVDGLQRLPENL